MTLCTTPAAEAADPQPYRVEFASTGNGAIDSTLRATSELDSLRETAPVSPLGLIVRARGDVDRLKTVLESYGYYQSTVTITVQGLPLTSSVLADELNALSKDQAAHVALSFTLGPLYHLNLVTLQGSVPESAAGAFTLKTGAPAVASEVLGAGAHLQSVLQEQGYAFAKVDPPVAYEDATRPLLDVSFQVTAGERVKIGEIRLKGLVRLHEQVVRRRLTVHTGDLYRPSVIDAARRDLLSMGPIGTVSVEVGQSVDATGGVPITFVLRERKRHSVTLNAAFSSDLGGSGGVVWTDRNVFGHAEQLDVKASVINLGGSDTTGVGYDTSVKLTLPDVGHRDQSLALSVGAIKQYLEAYDQQAVTSSATLARKLSSVWIASAGVSTAEDHIIQNGETFNYTLISLPLSLNYDSTHLASPLDDPTHGMRDSVSVAPTQSVGHPSATFIITQIKLASYFDLHELGLTDPGRTVLAVRALAGQALGASQYTSLPPDQRFYAGGSGTIRGYSYQLVGPVFKTPELSANGKPVLSDTGTPVLVDTQIPTGGIAIAATSFEFRQRFGTNWGGAVFVDGGQVGSNSKTLPTDFKFGVGAGVRYYTPIGPIRLDFAIPLNQVAGVDEGAFQVYIGLGQAF